MTKKKINNKKGKREKEKEEGVEFQPEGSYLFVVVVVFEVGDKIASGRAGEK